MLLANTIVAGNWNNCEDGSPFCTLPSDVDRRSDCAGELDSQGFNLLGTRLNPGENQDLEPRLDPTIPKPLDPCVFRSDRDQIGPFQDLRLGPLARNGGLTETHALLAGSPAINNGNPSRPGGEFNCIPFDQRLLPRPFGGRCDIGAFEFGVINVPNSMLTETRPEPSIDSTPVPGGPAGTVTFRLTYTNVGNVPISILVFEVARLTNGNLVLNADAFRGRRGVGARISAPPNLVLRREESFTVDFMIGRQTPDSFDFDVDVLGMPMR